MFEFFNDGWFFMAEKVISLITVSVAPVSISIIIYFSFMSILVRYNLGLPTFSSARNMYISGRSISGTIRIRVYIYIYMCVCVCTCGSPCMFVDGWPRRGSYLQHLWSITGVSFGHSGAALSTLARRPHKELFPWKLVRLEEKDKENQSVQSETQKRSV